MPKLTKFAIAPSGVLVYRSSGRKVPDRYGYEIRNKNVYKNGRRIGTIGKGTSKEQKIINAADNRRVKREQAAQRRQQRQQAPQKRPTPEPSIDIVLPRTPETPNIRVPQRPTELGYPVDHYQDFREIAEVNDNIISPTLPFAPPGIVTVGQRSYYNFASLLNRAVEAGYLTEEEAQKYFEYYQDANDKGRTKLWDEMYDYFEDVGYVDSE